MRVLSKFWKSRMGNVALTTALALPPIMALSLGAIEYAMFSSKKQLLEQAADAAALAAMNEAVIAYRSLEDVDLEELIRAEAEAVFQAQIGKLDEVRISQLQIEPVVKNNELTVEVNYSASYNTQFYQFAGQQEIEIGGSSQATVSAAAYMNITLLFDNSASMGIGATVKDEEIYVEHTGCAFSCHFGGGWFHVSPYRGGLPVGDPNIYDALREAQMRELQLYQGKYLIPWTYSDYDVGRLFGAETRLDVAKSGAIGAVRELSGLNLEEDQITFNVASFDNILDPVVTHGDEHAGNFNYIMDAIESGVQFKHWDGGTNAAHSIKQLLETLPEGGSGRTADDRLQYIVVLSDGMQNAPKFVRTTEIGNEDATFGQGYWARDANIYPVEPTKDWGGHHVQHAFNPIACEWMAEKNISPMFITTNYIRPSVGPGTDYAYFDVIESLRDDLQKNLLDCTGDEEFIIAADTPEEIKSAFVEFFGILASPLRLSSRN